MGHIDLATYSNTGQAVDKWTAESVREMVMDCSRRGREDGDGCWHIEGEPQHWQRLADELNRVTAEATAEEGSSRVQVGSSTWTVKKVCELLERNTYADGRTTEYDSLGNGYEVNVYSTDYQAIADELNEACTKSYIVADATGQNPSSHEDESDNHVSFGGRKVTFDAEDVLKLLHRNQDCTDATAYYFNQHGLQAIAATLSRPNTTSNQESIVRSFLRKISPNRDWDYLGEHEHALIADLVDDIAATLGGVDISEPHGADGNLDQSQIDWLRCMPDGWDGTQPTLGGGKLTAEQVMAIAGKHQPDYCSDTHICFDWQAIADALNLNGTVNGTADGTPMGHVTMDDGTVPIAATLGCGECRNTWDVELTERLRFQCSECGAVSLEITPSYCPACERKAVKR